MVQLSETWFVEGNIDFESKKYTILAYLQRVNACFKENKLYPQLSDIIFHYNNIIAFKNNKKFLQQQFPKRLTGLQIQKLEVLYEELISDSELMAELEDITYYAMKNMKKTIDMGANIYEEVEKNIHIEPIGILPLQSKEGYFFLSQPNYNYTRVYYYYVSIFEKSNDKYRALKSQFVDEWERNIVNTYESIKLTLMKERKNIPAPAVYAIESKARFPLEETILPVAKRSFVRYLSHNTVL
ncbi:MAG: hypothetical protein JNL70_24975 [Saprospiraceae bacterium]|nr:hypothetical protein [Saprospiraceae bacterium]